MNDKTSDKTSDKRLLPCPFCGGEAKLMASAFLSHDAFVMCKSCGAKTLIHSSASRDDAKMNAIKAWNTRKPVDDVVEALEEHIRFCELCHEEFKNASMSLTYEIQINSYKNAIEIVKEHFGKKVTE